MTVYNMVIETFPIHSVLSTCRLKSHFVWKKFQLPVAISCCKFSHCPPPSHPSATTWTLWISDTGTLLISEKRQPRKVSLAEAEARRQEWLCQAKQHMTKTLKPHREEG